MKEYSKPIIEEEVLELLDIIAESQTFGSSQPGDKLIPDIW